MAQTSHQRVILDMDSSESLVDGEQEGANYNGHFESVCYHPRFLPNHFGDCEGAMLRPGNVHSAERWRESLDQSWSDTRRRKSGCCSGPMPPFPSSREYLKSKHTGYAMRLPANGVLQRYFRHLLKQPVGRPPRACPELAEGCSGIRVSYSRGSG